MYFKMLLMTLTVLIEVGILYLQKILGPRTLLPSFLKKQSYQYYIDVKEIDKNNYNVIVV